MERLAEQGRNLGGSTSRLLKLLDQVGPSELQAAIEEAIKCETPHLAAINHILERRRYARSEPPPIGTHLPQDPRVQGSVRPHSLSDYDALGDD